MKKILKVTVASILLGIVFFTTRDRVQAQQIVFQENFDGLTVATFPSGWTIARNRQWANASLPCMNQATPASWRVANFLGNNRAGITINGPDCVTEIIPNSFNISDTSNYEYEIDFMFPSTSGIKNLAFRYKDSDEWYGIKFIGSNQIEFQKVNQANYNFHLGPIINLGYSLQANTVHNFKVRTTNNSISFYLNNQLLRTISDQDPKVNSGTIALQASMGPIASSNTVYFDNIKVTDLTITPTPTPTTLPYLDVPHLSQNDPAWGDEVYDTPSKWDPVPGNKSINRWGCAMTSAAMILNYHGFDKGPDGQETNPLNLNEYLKNNKGYSDDGAILWPKIATYAKFAVENGHVATSAGKLEFEYQGYSIDNLETEIEATQPAVIKIVMNDKGTPKWDDDNLHFVVGKGVGDNDEVYINDPEEASGGATLLSDHYGSKTYRQIGRFIKSNTDLSYLWLNVYNPNLNILVEHNGQKTGIDPNGNEYHEIPGADYFAEGVIADVNNPDDQDAANLKGSMVFVLPKPEVGEYHITFSGNAGADNLFDLHVFDPDGNSHVYDDYQLTPGDAAQTYTLIYDPQTINEGEMLPPATFESLRQLINSHTSAGNIKNTRLAQALINKLTYIEGLYPKYPTIARTFLQTVKITIEMSHLIGDINDAAYADISHELTRLIEELSD